MAVIVVSDVATTTYMRGLTLISMAARNWWNTETMTSPLPTPKSPAGRPMTTPATSIAPAQNRKGSRHPPFHSCLFITLKPIGRYLFTLPLARPYNEPT
ncbi:MAG: hypothetical protein V6Z81_10935 [Parvularculales bacterium]